MAKHKDWSDWRVLCSGISEIMVRPKGATPVTGKERARLEKLLQKEDPKDNEATFIEAMRAKDKRFKNPELSATAIKFLMRRYAWEKYNKRVVSIDAARTAAMKGQIMEAEAIEIISSIDKQKYVKECDIIKNDHLIGICDVFHGAGRKIIDVKANWNIYSFLPNHQNQIDSNYWYQMQGYMELYDADVAEVCFVLVNTPAHLIQRERERHADRFLTGEISKDKYIELMEGIGHSFNYNKIPIRKRVIRQIIPRHKPVMPLIYDRVAKCREWLNNFEEIHASNEKIIVLPDEYVGSYIQQEDNFEHNPSDPREDDEG